MTDNLDPEKVRARAKRALLLIKEIRAKLAAKKRAGTLWWFGFTEDPSFQNLPGPDDDPAQRN